MAKNQIVPKGSVDLINEQLHKRFYYVCKLNGNYNIKTFVSARKHEHWHAGTNLSQT